MVKNVVEIKGCGGFEANLNLKRVLLKHNLRIN